MLIFFRVIANPQVGSGHVFRSLTLAHEMHGNNISFITEHSDKETVEKIVDGQFRIINEKKESIIDRLLSEGPDIVVNDILNTEIDDVVPLREKGIKVVNFEDLGVGASYSDITINELFETPLIKSKNILWGNKYFFVREEFENAREHKSSKKLNAVLLSFGGIDKLNCTLRAYLAIKDACILHDIKINIVTGPGYLEFDHLKKLTQKDKNVILSNTPGVISSIMEKCDIAITSNGRTVYELAHMNIPSIAIPQHDREGTHEFASSKTGFIVLNKNDPQSDEISRDISNAFQSLITDDDLRKKLFLRMKNYKFDDNRKKVIDLIIDK